MEFRPMSPEEIERTLQFLLGQQAQFAADLANLSGQTDRIADAMIGLTGIVGRLAEAQERTDERLGARIDELGQYIRTVESHLNVLIGMFEAHLRDDHGRKPS